MDASSSSRIRRLDLIRGIAVLGILAINITSFAAPDSAAFSPNLPRPGAWADNLAYAFNLVWFEGKMRALFSILFGAGLLLFIKRKEAGGADGAALQLRRLLWLALFGLLHFALLWDGDILFLYACIGIAALPMRRAPPAALLVVALGALVVWQAWGIASWIPSVMREAQVAAGTASPSQAGEHAAIIAERRAQDATDLATTLAPYGMATTNRLCTQFGHPLAMVIYTWGETLAYILVGMALLKSGFFAGAWPQRRVRLVACAALLPGLAATLAFTAWAHGRGYPELAMHLALAYGLAVPHLLMAVGYAALLVLAAPWLLQRRLGQRIEAAGRMALSNYIGSTAFMCALFSGWGLGLFGRYGAAAQWPFVLGYWALMLGWSEACLARFRQGPLEWAWRSLTAWRIEPFRR